MSRMRTPCRTPAGPPPRPGGMALFLRAMNRSTTLEAEARFRRWGAHPALAVACMLVLPLWTFLRRFIGGLGFLQGGAGWNAALMESSATFWSHAKWWHRSWRAKGGEAGRPWPMRQDRP